MKVWVLVGMYEGLVEEISVHKTEEGAEKAFRKWTNGLTLEELERREEKNPEETYACTRIFEAELQE